MYKRICSVATPGLMASVIVLAFTMPVGAQVILRVNNDATVGGNGSTWNLTGPNAAFKFMQDALATASPIAQGGMNVEIWVAAGTYFPDESAANPSGTNDLQATFLLESRIAIFGGFEGTENSQFDRQIDGQSGQPVFESILSGDLAENDFPNEDLTGNTGENSKHVVDASYTDNTAILDGFVIRGGNSETAPNNFGGGLANQQGQAIISRCLFDSNRGVEGGAIGNHLAGTLLTVVDCEFTNNYAIVQGGAVSQTSGANAQFERCRFYDNRCTQGVGGEGGGAVYLRNGASCTLVSCQFQSNRAMGSGGAVNVVAGSAIDLFNCLFIDNQGGTAGGVSFDGQSAGYLVNCVFSGNSSLGGGSAVDATDCSISLVNCSLSGNVTPSAGFGALNILSFPQTNINIFQSILWNNISAGLGGQAAQISLQAGGSGGLVYPYRSIVEGWDGSLGGSANNGLDPMFVAPLGSDGIAGTLDDDLRLRSYSPAIDTGDNNPGPRPLPSTDIEGNLRILDGDGSGAALIDRGAFEYGGPVFGGVLFVSQSVVTGGDGTSWTSPIKEVRDALPLAKVIVDGGRGPVQVWVAAAPPGSQYPNDAYRPEGFNGPRDATFALYSGVELYGGFAGTETQLSQRNPEENVTILSGDLNGGDAPPLNLSDNSLHVVTAANCDNTALIDGFSIRSGNANATNPDDRGAGLSINSASPTVSRCVLELNQGANGGAVCIDGTSSPLLQDCRFSENRATSRGGAVITEPGGSVQFLRGEFIGNISQDNGGAVELDHATNALFLNCLFYDNRSELNQGGAIDASFVSQTIDVINCWFFGNRSLGGGALNNDSPPQSSPETPRATWRVTNSVFSGNTGGSGSAFSNYQANAFFTNCTIVNNDVPNPAPPLEWHAALNCRGPEVVFAVTNSILWNNTLFGNTATSESQISTRDGATVQVAQSIVTGGWPGVGNSSADPLLLDENGQDNTFGTLDDNVRLTFGSPGIDSGDSLALGLDVFDIDSDGDSAENLPVDAAGLPRYVDDPGTANVGPGNPPTFVDRGAYEFISDCVTCPGPRRWLRPFGGTVNVAGNWTPSIPICQPNVLGCEFETLFDHRGNTFAIAFADVPGATLYNTRTVVANGFVTFDLAGKTYRLNATAQPSIVVGNGPNAQASLDILNGTLRGVTAEIGKGDLNATGLVNVLGGSQLRLSQDIRVGRDGMGELHILGGSTSVASFGFVGDQSGSQGLVEVADPGSEWIVPLFLTINNGELNVRDGGLVHVGFDIFISQDGRITGDGTIIGNVVNFGEVIPGNSPGLLIIDGDYVQLGEVPDLGTESGSLRMEISGTGLNQFDQILVTGTASLGGGLFVNLNGGFVPDEGQPLTLPIIDAMSGIDPTNSRFDVAFFPGITGNRFLNVQYPTTLRGGAQTIQLITVPLSGDISLADPDSAPVAGTPVAVAKKVDPEGDLAGATTMDLDGDGDDDLVVVLAGSPGQVTVLRTDFNMSGQYAPTAQTWSVGDDPSAVALGNFDGVGGLDIAVANAGDNSVTIYSNQGGSGTFNQTPMATIPVGAEPRAIVAAALGGQGDTTIDIAVANSADDTVEVYSNDGAGDFTLVATIPVGRRPIAIEAVDPDQDKDIDIIVVNDVDNTMMALANSGSGFMMPTGMTTFAVDAGPRQLIAAEFNAVEAHPYDVVTVSPSASTVSVLLNKTATADELRYAPAVSLPVTTDPSEGTPSPANPGAIAALDLDQDAENDLDLAIIADNDDQTGRVVRVLRNDGTDQQLAFAPAAPQTAGVAPISLVAGDLDGDNRDDLVSINDTAFAVQEKPGNGGIPRGPAGEVTLRLSPAAAIAGDTNCDGALDSGDIGSFALALIDPSAYQTSFPTCSTTRADMNNDGQVDGQDVQQFVADLMVAGLKARKPRVLNSGTGFSSRSRVAIPFGR